MHVIELKSIVKKYKNKNILNSISLEINEGDFLVLCGESGAGKTTLLNIICGLESSDNGEVSVLGKNINKMNRKERKLFFREKVGVLYQDFYLQPQLSVYENIALPGYIAGISKRKIEKRVSYLSKIFGIEEILRQRISEISGGQAERICIARSMFMNPKIVIADEPTNNLDPSNVENIITLFKKLNEIGTTVVIASHDDRVKKAANRVVNLDKGGLYEN
jgi:ABC-type lipoprotein export system ATPase subunit